MTKRFAAVAVAVAYAWWATSLRPFTTAALVATMAGGTAAVIYGAWWSGRARAEDHSEGDTMRAGIGVWLILAVAVAGWELASFVQHPRAEHPTLSSLANDVLRHHPLRALAMVAWLTLGMRIPRR